MKNRDGKNLLKEQLTNKVRKDIWEVIRTVQCIRPLMKDSLYKEGWDNCLELIRIGIKKANI